MSKTSPDSIQKFNRRRFLAWAMLISFTIATSLFTIPAIAIYEWNLSDVWARMLYPKHVSTKVAVVGIDDDLFKFGKHTWPLEKDTYFNLIMYLEEMGAKVIAFDLDFTSGTQRCNQSDTLFLSIVEWSPNVVIGYGFKVEPKNEKNNLPDSLLPQIDTRFAIGKGNITLPLKNAVVRSADVPYKELHQVAQAAGFFNRNLPMSDGSDRYMPLLLAQDSLLFPSIALASVQRYFDKTASYDMQEKVVELGSYQWDISSNTQMPLNFTDSIPVYLLSSIIVSQQDHMSGKTPEIGKDQLNGKIIFVGYMGSSAGDLGVNPVSKKRDAQINHDGKTSMVMLHAYSANTMLESRTPFVVGRWGAMLFSAFSLFFVFLLFLKVKQNVLNVLLPILFILVVFASYMLYNSYVIMPVLESLFTTLLFTVAGVFINYYDSTHETRYISSVFRTYISPELIDEMVKNHTIPKLGGEQIEGTAFFTDIEKFSTFSEIFTPEELINVLNIYFSEMTEILKKNKGTLDKFIGDAIVAIFGAPCFYEQNAEQACMAAWNMQQALNALREKWKLDPNLCDKVGNMRMRIGINSGPFIVGNLGCSDRKNYTMIGDTVNLAARLESGAKQYGVYTLVGETTFESAKKSFLFRSIDRIVVMGRREPVSIYELLAPLEEVTVQMQTLSEKYSSAMQCYVSGDFAAALSLFKEACDAEINKYEKNPSKVMVDRCEELIKDHPANWDGVYTMRSK